MWPLAEEENRVRQEIAELQEKLGSSREELSGLKAEFNRATSELEDESARLKSLGVKLAVTKKEIEDSENKIFLLKKKRLEIDDNVFAVLEEVESEEARLKELEEKRRTLSHDIAEIKSNAEQDLNALGALESERQGTLSLVEKREADKHRLSEEISNKLSNTSLERDRIESEVNDLKLVFMRQVDERNRVNELYSEREAVIAGLKEEATRLEQRCSQLEELEALQNRRASLKDDVEGLDGEARSSGSKAEEARSLLSDKEQEFNALSAANAENKDSIASLEKEVGPYDELALKVKKAEDKVAESRTLIEQSLSELKRLLVDNSSLESQVRLMGGKANSIVKTVDSVG